MSPLTAARIQMELSLAFHMIFAAVGMAMPGDDADRATLTPADYVTVVGQVRPFVRADLEKDYDWFDTMPDLSVDLESRPVIVAEVVRTSDGTEVATDDQKATRVFVASAGESADTRGRFR